MTRRAVPVRSLRARVTAVVVAVVAVTLLVSGVVVDVGLSAALERDQESRLTDRAARVDVLLAQGVTPDLLVDELDGRGVSAVRVSATGALLEGVRGPRGREPDRDAVRDGDAGPDRSENPGPDDGPGREDRLVRTLPDGTVLALRADPDEVDEVLGRLRGLLVAVGLAGLAGAALVLFTGVTAALRPLDAMTRVARAITTGDRGRRLHPTTTDTEIGRTAAAFDEMLDALEAERQRSEASADEARRSETSTRRFLSDAAHELRTPLAGMQTLAETLVRDSDVDRETREELAIALVRETSRASGLVTDMLDLARIEGGQPLDRAPVDLVALAADQVDRLRLLAPGLDVAVTPPRGTTAVVVPADAETLRRVLVNLTDNARRHVRPGGAVRLTVTRDADAAHVVVANDGPVVPVADRERIFARLVRLDDARARDAGGAGLGRASARALARAHGGDLTDRPAPDDGGSEFVVTLPEPPSM